MANLEEAYRIAVITTIAACIGCLAVGIICGWILANI